MVEIFPNGKRTKHENWHGCSHCAVQKLPCPVAVSEGRIMLDGQGASEGLWSGKNSTQNEDMGLFADMILGCHGRRRCKGPDILFCASVPTPVAAWGPTPGSVLCSLVLGFILPCEDRWGSSPWLTCTQPPSAFCSCKQSEFRQMGTEPHFGNVSEKVTEQQY